MPTYIGFLVTELTPVVTREVVCSGWNGRTVVPSRRNEREDAPANVAEAITNPPATTVRNGVVPLPGSVRCTTPAATMSNGGGRRAMLYTFLATHPSVETSRRSASARRWGMNTNAPVTMSNHGPALLPPPASCGRHP